MDQVGVPPAVDYERDDLVVDLGGVLHRHVPELGRGPALLPDVLHQEAVLVVGDGFGHRESGLVVPLEVPELLGGPGVDELPAVAGGPLEPGVSLHVLADALEGGGRGAVYLEGHGFAVLVGGVEHVALLPRGNGVVDLVYQPSLHEGVDRHQGLPVEDLAFGLTFVAGLVGLEGVDALLKVGVLLVV